jgi:hypothetical protein
VILHQSPFSISTKSPTCQGLDAVADLSQDLLRMVEEFAVLRNELNTSLLYMPYARLGLAGSAFHFAVRQERCRGNEVPYEAQRRSVPGLVPMVSNDGYFAWCRSLRRRGWERRHRTYSADRVIAIELSGNVWPGIEVNQGGYR